MTIDPSATSPIVEMVKRYPIKSKNTIAHIARRRKGISSSRTATRSCVNCGASLDLAHNSDLKDYSPVLVGVYQPVGTTDSGLAFVRCSKGLVRLSRRTAAT